MGLLGASLSVGLRLKLDQSFTGPVAASVGYVCLLEFGMMNQVLARVAAGGGDPHKCNRFDYGNRRWEFGDRVFLNFLEQTPNFLLLLWLSALFVDAGEAGRVAAVYLVARFFYPVFWAVGGKWTLLIELSTQTCYGALNYWKARLIGEMMGIDVRSHLPASTPAFIGACALLHLGIFTASTLVQMPIIELMARRFPETKGKDD